MENPEVAPSRKRSRSRRRNNAFLFFDAPFWSDWICWLTAFGVYTGARTVFAIYRNDLAQGLNQFSFVALTTDVLISTGVQFALFGLGIGAIRTVIRRRRKRGRNREPEPLDRTIRKALWLQFIGLVLVLPVLMAFGTESASRPVADAVEKQTCQSAQDAVDALKATNAATDREEALQSLDDGLDALDLMARNAQETDNEIMSRAAQSAQESMVASLEAIASGDENRGRRLAGEADPHFDAVAAECARLGLRIEQ